MVDILGIPREKIDIIPSAASADMKEIVDKTILEDVRQKYGLPANYILFVGNFNPRKNLERLIRAFDLLKEQTSTKHELVIAGGAGWKFNAESALRSIRHKGDIHFLDYIADLDMPALYSAADLFVFPTLYEGFGLPIIEAQLCGTPVLTSNISAMPEVGGEGALYVSPYDVAAIADYMEKVLADNTLRSKIVCKGFENAKRFSWEESARKLDCIVERIMEEQ
jgi:glycosyltransferase involved in cell wall biosynthesis